MRKLKLEELQRISVDEFKSSEKNPLIVVLDNVRSMYNVGAVLRTADAFLIEKVYLCGITPKPPHREIRKTAIGAEESVDWEARENCVELIYELKQKGYRILSVEQTEKSTNLMDFTHDGRPCAVVFGHEVEGVNQEVVNLSEIAIEIPQFGTKHSLNISVATGIVLYDLILAKGLHN
ncbi:MAG: RNA methyltransferase [Bacteroidia bacterium]